MCGRIKSSCLDVLDLGCDENRSEGLQKSSREASELMVDEREESRGRFGSLSKDGSGSGWGSAGKTAAPQEGGGARCVDAGVPLGKHDMTEREVLLGESEQMGEAGEAGQEEEEEGS